jgi:hypothetical protein
MSMPYEIFGIPVLICLAIGFYQGFKGFNKNN